jgi:hypothetical protein
MTWKQRARLRRAGRNVCEVAMLAAGFVLVAFVAALVANGFGLAMTLWLGGVR